MPFQFLLLSFALKVLLKPYLRSKRRRRKGLRVRDRAVRFAWRILVA
jgi:hypothetical protein